MLPSEVAPQRLSNQRLTASPFARPEDVVRWLGALQAQEYRPAMWSIGQRVADVADDAVSRAIADGTILRTHVLRPTWHFVLPDDIRWMQELTAGRVRAASAYRYRQLGLNEELFARSNSAIAEALEGGRHLTRREIAEVLARAGIAGDGQVVGHIVMRAELDALVCSGAPRGRQQTYALLAERAPRARSLDPDEALAELTLRYFTGHGPATVRDYRWWSGLTAADARRGLDLIGEQLEHSEVDGRSYRSAAAPAPPVRPSPDVHLLQAYDEFIIGYTESRDALDLSGTARAHPPPPGVTAHMVIVDGQAAAYWRRSVERGMLRVEIRPARTLLKRERTAIEAEADRYGRFVGLPAEIAYLGV